MWDTCAPFHHQYMLLLLLYHFITPLWEKYFGTLTFEIIMWSNKCVHFICIIWDIRISQGIFEVFFLLSPDYLSCEEYIISYFLLLTPSREDLLVPINIPKTPWVRLIPFHYSSRCFKELKKVKCRQFNQGLSNAYFCIPLSYSRMDMWKLLQNGCWFPNHIL